MDSHFSKTKEQLTRSAEELLGTLETRLDELVAPTRKSVLERFPIVFTLLTTLGVVMTFLGIELLIAQWSWLIARPWLVLVVGVGILVFTGTLYKKLG